MRSLGNYRSLGNINDSQKQPAEPSVAEKVVKGVAGAAPVVGGIAGGLAGAAVGIPALGLGAIPGGAAGTTAGTGAGIAFGESLKNLTGFQDKNMDQLATEAWREPLAAGAIDLATAGTIKAAEPVIEGAVGLGRGILRSFVPKNASVKTYASVFKTSRKLSEKLDPEAVGKVMTRYGLYGDFDDMISWANKITGENGLISKITRNTVGNVLEGVETSDALAAMKQAGDNATAVDPKTIKRMKQQITRILSKGEQKAPTALNALDALDAERELENLGYGILNSAEDSLTSGDKKLLLQQQAKMYIDAAESIGDNINKLAKKIKSIDQYKTPEILEELSKTSPELAKDFKKATDVSSLRSIAAPFVRLKKLAEASKAYGGSAFIDSIGGKPGLTQALIQGWKQPEAATARAVGIDKIANSPVGSASKMVGNVATSISNNGDELMRILTQIGLVPRKE